MFPCEYASRYVLPAIKRAIVLELYKRGYSVSQISQMLGVTPAAVSQYLRGKRGRSLALNEARIRAIVDAMVQGKDAREEICALCREVSVSALH